MPKIRLFPPALFLALSAPPAMAQSEAILRRYFEGMPVRVKIDLPGTEQGLDVRPGTSQKVNYPEHANRLRRFGTAIRAGQTAMVTRVRLKGDHIEFHLDGGGYGTFGEETSSDVYVPHLEKSEREKNLEKDLEKATDPAVRRRIREELDALRRDRERQEARLKTEAARAEAMKEAVIRQKRLEGGSRFNLRYPDRVPPEELTPDAVTAALSDFLDFGDGATDPRPRPGNAESLRGLTVEQVEALLGRPESVTSRREGTLTVTVATYFFGARRLRAEFVEGVLIRFTSLAP
jgi:hypothetical protein